MVVALLINMLLLWAVIVDWKFLITIQLTLIKGLNVILLFGLVDQVI